MTFPHSFNSSTDNFSIHYYAYQYDVGGINRLSPADNNSDILFRLINLIC